MRQQVIVRDGGECQLCHVPCVGKGNAIVDHIVSADITGVICPIENLRLLCATCHAKRTLKDRRTGGA